MRDVGARIVLDPQGEVERVHAVYTEDQHAANLVAAVAVIAIDGSNAEGRR